MKRFIFFLLFVTLLLHVEHARSQSSVNKNPSRPSTVSEREVFLKNANKNEALSMRKVPAGEQISNNSSDKLNFNNYPVDVRVNKYYSSTDLAKMPVQKKKQLNYLFTESFEAVKAQNPACSPMNKNDINVMDYEFLRKQSERTEVIINEKCDQKIVLHSLDEVEKAYQKISE